MKIKHDSQGPRFEHECEDCKPQHTPTPWRVAESAAEKDCWYMEAQYQGFNEGPDWTSVGEDDGTFDKEDAAFIVKAVNCHEALLAACKRARNSLDLDTQAIEQLDHAIAKASGEI